MNTGGSEVQRKYSKTLYWGKLLSITGGTQILVQGVGLTCGILVIRLLPVKEYALYTIANTVLGTMTILADGGIVASVLAQGGKVWQEKDKLGVVLGTGMHMRKLFACGSLLISTPILFYLLMHNNASIMTALLISVSLIPAFFAELSDSILEISPKIYQDILPLQKNQIAVSFFRLLLSTIALFLFPFTFIAILAAGLPRIWGNTQLKKISSKHVDVVKEVDPVVRTNILKFVRKFLPHSIYYSTSNQITIWIISLVGSARSVAQAGALSRIAVLLYLFHILINTLIIPRFARLQKNGNLLVKRYIQVHLLLLGLSCIFVLFGFLLSTQILWILGKQYAGLHTELVICIASSCIGTLAGASFHLNSSRGHVINPLLAIPINILAIVCAVTFLNISDLRGMLLISVVIELVQLLLNFIYGVFRLSRD